MIFELGDEQQAIAETARAMLAARGSGPDLWGELCELGWPGIAVAEEHGGQGLGVLELAVLLREFGSACAEAPLLGNTLAALAIEAGGSPGQKQELLGGLADGSSLGALELSGRRELVPDAVAGGLLVVASPESGEGFVHRAAAVEELEAIDPRRRHGRCAEGAEGEELPGDLRPGLDRAAVAVAAELVGLSQRALQITVEYVKERKQFGVPVGSFQAVQHIAARMLRDTECASVATFYAAWVADNEAAKLPLAATTAKASAAAAAKSVTAAAIQLHGGIGFTWEADVHWLFKRAQVDAAYLGGSGGRYAELARAVAANL